jgi:tetratricopeptide (TPR) repeat protein
MIPPLANAGRVTEARALLGDAVVAAERVFGRDSLRLAELLQMLASVEQLLHNDEQAVAHGVEAVRLFERHLGPDQPRTAEGRIALGSAMIQTKRYDEAIAVLQRAHDTFAAAADPPVFMLGHVAALQADALSRAGRDREALELSARALELFERAYPDGHVELAEILVKYADRIARSGDPAAARVMLERALTMVQDPALDPAFKQEIERALADLPRNK